MEMNYKLFKMMLCILTLFSILSSEASVTFVRNRRDAKGLKYQILDFIGRVEEQGRRAEWYNVTTEDGYILALFRIPPNSLSCKKMCSGPPVYLQHEIFTSADMFLTPKPERDLAYLLSDAGYDVWLGNVRGNAYTRRHQTLSPEELTFWNFSLDEMALKDLPAMIDHILKATGKSKLSYIGYSIGSTLSTILLSNRTDYNDKINLVVHLSHASIWKYHSFISFAGAIFSTLMREIAPQATFELFKMSEVIHLVMKHGCLKNVIFANLCKVVYAVFSGTPHGDIDYAPRKFLEWMLYYPAGSSGKVFIHILQHLRTGKFQYYDHEDDKNLRYYGQNQPPDYNLTNIAVPHSIFHGGNDVLTLSKNIPIFMSKLPRSTAVIYQPVKNYNHFDFIIDKNVKTLVYDKLLMTLSKLNKFP